MKKIIIYITLTISVLFGCKKVDLEPTPSNDPVFLVDANLGGDSLKWVAGVDDFYMFTEFSKDNFEVYTLTGRLAKDENCVSDCEESLTFSIRSSLPTTSTATFNIDQAIELGDFSFYENDPSGTGNVVGYLYSLNSSFSNPANPNTLPPDIIDWTLFQTNGDTILLLGSDVTVQISENSAIEKIISNRSYSQNSNCSILRYPKTP